MGDSHVRSNEEIVFYEKQKPRSCGAWPLSFRSLASGLSEAGGKAHKEHEQDEAINQDLGGFLDLLVVFSLPDGVVAIVESVHGVLLDELVDELSCYKDSMNICICQVCFIFFYILTTPPIEQKGNKVKSKTARRQFFYLRIRVCRFAILDTNGLTSVSNERWSNFSTVAIQTSKPERTFLALENFRRCLGRSSHWKSP